MTTLEAISKATITHSFAGRFGFGIDQWAYVPFDVPPGIQRIDVSTSHDRFSLLGVARNVLDLGVFGPAGHDLGNAEGFRGWSGGARTGFTLSTTDATPGYLAGPIDPGRWALALGPVVLNPLGMKWRAEVALHPGPTSAVHPGIHVAPTNHLNRGSDWYRGDLHVHTVHSDGCSITDDVRAAAKDAGLDFVVSTDHNTSYANREWAGSVTDGLLVVAGEEVTTRHGHWLAVALPPNGWVDWRYAPRDGVFARYAADVQAQGGLVVAAHPSVPLPGSLWEFGYRGVDAVEVWNGKWNVDDEMSLRTWLRLLRSGIRITAVGSSDSHGPHQPIGRPHTVVHAEELSPAGLVEALRRGRCYVAESSAVTVSLAAACVVGDIELTAGPGDTLPA
ncbi:MAG TPA: CehA/McbA family metallohydrolase, partial [Mycobacterium sp.]|nr:CehA/McbA family metallohydrolase [Mycobacterium sp.]